MNLTKLPNGTWVDLRTVTSIRVLPTERALISDTLFRARVIVRHGEMSEVLMANDEAHAQELADILAGMINESADKPIKKDQYRERAESSPCNEA